MYAIWQVNYYDVTLGGTNITYEDLNTNTITIAKVPYNNSLKIKVIPNSKYYFESYTCTNGYTISDLLVGSSYYTPQEITINNPGTILGGECTITMHARSYAATRHPKTCTGQKNCRTESGQSCTCTNYCWNGAGELACCETDCKPWSHTVCDKYEYDCSTYSCPNGGTLSGTTCVF